jgi:signal peptidase I
VPSDNIEPPLEESASGEVFAEAGAESEVPEDGTAGVPPQRKKKKSTWHELPVLLITAVALAFFIRAFLIQAFYIPSESMEHTLHGCSGCSGNDRVLVWKLGKHFGDPGRGDVVVFDGRGSGFSDSDEEKDFVKRVIGIPGDRVMCCDAEGRVVRNDKSLDEPYLFEDNHEPFGPIVVQKGELWVMGDHRSHSSDSRVNGPVPIDRVVGRAFLIVWPPSRIGTVD